MACAGEFRAGDARRQWSQLPPAILHMISVKITDIVDYIQFRSVCRSWRSAAKPSDLPPQSPLLLLPHDTDGSSDLSFFDLSGYNDPLRSLYDLPLGKISTFSSPETHNKIVCGSSFGWLALFDSFHSSLSLWNPFTRALIDLPPPSDLPPCVDPGLQCLKEFRRNLPPSFDPVRFGFELFLKPMTTCFDSPLPLLEEQFERLLKVGEVRWKVSLSSNPLVEGCSVIVVITGSTRYALCRIGDQKWSLYETSLPSPLASVVLHEGRFYAFHEDTHGALFGAPDRLSGTCGIVTILAPIDNEFFTVGAFYMVETDGELLMVVHYFVMMGEGMNWVKVFKLVSNREGLKWEPVDSLGCHAIFVSRNNSSMVCARDLDGCEEDCIYFSELCGSSREDLKEGVYYIDVYSLKECRFRPLSCRWICGGGGNATWLVPSLF